MNSTDINKFLHDNGVKGGNTTKRIHGLRHYSKIQNKSVKVRWKNKTKEEKSIYGKMMVTKREEKRKLKVVSDTSGDWQVDIYHKN